jgi:hypothetical protein
MALAKCSKKSAFAPDDSGRVVGHPAETDERFNRDGAAVSSHAEQGPSIKT